MNNRQRMILWYLSLADKPVTSEELGKKLGVSSRTVKSDMACVSAELEANGAKLVSRRNCGYFLEVVDKERFQTLYTLISIKSGSFSAVNEEERLLYIARKLAGSRQGVLVDELEEELYLTRSALRGPLHDAIRFCESFHLKTTSSMGRGLRVVGEEHLIRMALTELFELHFHKVELGQADEEYTQWVRCEYQERQDIRHAFLKVLRESRYAMRDSVTQRIAMYLIIARNRRRAGLRISLPASWIAEVRKLPVYAVAAEIYYVLQSQFSHYEMDSAETAFLAIYMLSNLDPDMRRGIGETAPMVAPRVRQIAAAMLSAVRKISGSDFLTLPDAQPMLEQVILPILVGARYGLDGHQCFDYSYENSYLHLPLEMYYARLLAEELQAQAGCLVSVTDLSVISCYVTAMLRRVRYPLHPLRLLVTNSIGVDFARVAAEELWQQFPRMIQSITPVELYEIRGMDPSTYDAVLVGNVKQNQSKMFGYNYDAPATTLLLTEEGRDFGGVYNDLLILSYHFEDFLPDPSCVTVEQDFLYYDPAQTFQYLSGRYARDKESAEELERRLARRNEQFQMAQGSCAVVIAERSLCKSEGIALYHLKKQGQWHNRKIHWILFLCIDGGDLKRVKAMGSFLDMLIKGEGQFEQFAQSPHQTMMELMKKSVQIL